MVYVAVSHNTMGKVFIGFVNAALTPEVHNWLRTPHSDTALDNIVTHYAIPVLVIDVTVFGPVSSSWRQGDLRLERHSTPGHASTRHNVLHTTADTYRYTTLTTRDRPVYQVSSWMLPLDPVLTLVHTLDGDIATTVISPVNMILLSQPGAYVANFGTTLHYPDTDSGDDADTEQQPQGNDDSPRPSSLDTTPEEERVPREV